MAMASFCGMLICAGLPSLLSLFIDMRNYIVTSPVSLSFAQPRNQQRTVWAGGERGESSTRTFTMVTDQGWGPLERLRILGFRKKKTIIDVACEERGEDNEVLRVPEVWTIQRGGRRGSVATAHALWIGDGTLGRSVGAGPV